MSELLSQYWMWFVFPLVLSLAIFVHGKKYGPLRAGERIVDLKTGRMHVVGKCGCHNVGDPSGLL